ncbi:hypothetical protein [Streptomyces himalayensis]|uniref:Integral membrane protein n=1 Tax=Streptomyces himalayensis subsp. himalayensis TaxID=2756131 RepID=A0A7W0IAK5_9ACTN|nr:hypothetical protein [Streptomyces himalayensis]MBA2948199.1 hypothetical protein [Streptomyces himalayensis subsp. himalayensis]
MTIADRQISALLRQVASQDVVELIHPFAEWKTFGALVHIAECYGFRYAEVRHVGRQKEIRIFLVRDTSPAAQQRAAANAAAYPQAGGGGPVPGMHPGTLVPLPEAEADVDLVTTLIRYDAAGSAVNRKQLMTMAWGSAGLFLLLALLTGKFAVLLPLAVLTPVFLLGSLRIGTARREKLGQRLAAAGCTPVRDEYGRDRFARPGTAGQQTGHTA